MYSDKENVGILTALLLEHGVKHAVVCPGSRNSPIVHNLCEAPAVTCYAITDERSAAFCALGICQLTRQPVVVCVTSGSALLNVMPAVAEAAYQHLPLVVVSADRPAAWIDQLDGQTLPQANALTQWVKKAVTLPEPTNDEQRWWCNRLVNEALLAAQYPAAGPVHINVPITEPLFCFHTNALPQERVIKQIAPTWQAAIPRNIAQYHKLLIIIGQSAGLHITAQQLGIIRQKAVVLCEPLSSAYTEACHFDEMLAALQEDAGLHPDLVIYMGDTVVSKRLKRWIRQLDGVPSWRVCDEQRIEDTFCSMERLLTLTGGQFIAALAQTPNIMADENYLQAWRRALATVKQCNSEHRPAYSQMMAVRLFEQQIENSLKTNRIHYANSSAVRLACVYARHPIYCNRGVNGIEGSLSTAAGMSMATDDHVYCVIGDLSFFYDQNALWNTQLRGNLRILLLNNGCGGIFHRLDGLQDSGARDTYIAAQHHTSAQGVCRAHDVGYLCAKNESEVEALLPQLVESEAGRPILLEVFTDPKADANACATYEQTIKNYISWQENGNQ